MRRRVAASHSIPTLSWRKKRVLEGDITPAASALGRHEEA
jgi:hypothetical protein